MGCRHAQHWLQHDTESRSPFQPIFIPMTREPKTSLRGQKAQEAQDKTDFLGLLLIQSGAHGADKVNKSPFPIS